MEDDRPGPERLEELGARLALLRQEAIEARGASGIERRWREDEDAYQGRDDAVRRDGVVATAAGTSTNSLRTSAQTQPVRSTTFVQLTRQKTNAAAARLSDMLYPTDDKNWAIKPTPVPELAKALKEERDTEYEDPEVGGPIPHPAEERNVTLGDIAIEQMAQATEKSQAMEAEINDALVECQYNYAGRRVILDAAILGTGILKGPIVVNRTHKIWDAAKTEDGQRTTKLTVHEETRPASVRVDPWNFFPDPACGDNIQDGRYVFEREYFSSRALRDLARTENYFSDQINEVLREGPERHTNQGERSLGVEEGEYADSRDSRFEVWTYIGEIAREDMVTAGAVEQDEDQDQLAKMSAVIVMCNARVIMAQVNPMDTEDLPYDVYTWDRLTHSPWGIGIPYLMRYAQRTINTAWRAMLDNATVSYAPQIIMRREQVNPADGRWEISGRKIWYATEDVQDVGKAFEVFNIPSNQQELQAIIDMAMNFADQETSLPQISQGEQGDAPDTVGGMTILMNSANTVLRRLVKQYDDMVTRPHIRRYYDWFMQYSDKEEVKGDFEIDARGSTALIVRDQQQQALMQLMGAATHPVFGKYVDPEKIFRKSLEANHVPPIDVMRTKEEILEIENKPTPAPPDPAIEVAQIKAKADVEKMRIDTESERTNQQMRMQEAADNRAAKLNEMALQRDLKILEMAHERNMKISDVKAQLAKTTIETRSKRRDAAANRRIKQSELMSKAPPTKQ